MANKNELYLLELILKPNGEDSYIEKTMKIISEDKNGYTICPLDSTTDNQYMHKKVLDNRFLTINKVHFSSLQNQKELHLTIVSSDSKTAYFNLLDFLKKTIHCGSDEDLKVLLIKKFEKRIDILLKIYLLKAIIKKENVQNDY